MWHGRCRLQYHAVHWNVQWDVQLKYDEMIWNVLSMWSKWRFQAAPSFPVLGWAQPQRCIEVEWVQIHVETVKCEHFGTTWNNQETRNTPPLSTLIIVSTLGKPYCTRSKPCMQNTRTHLVTIEVSLWHSFQISRQRDAKRLKEFTKAVLTSRISCFHEEVVHSLP